MRLRSKLLLAVLGVMAINYLLVAAALLSVQTGRFLAAEKRIHRRVAALLEAALARTPEADPAARLRAEAARLAEAGLLHRRWRLLGPQGHILGGSSAALAGAGAARRLDWGVPVRAPDGTAFRVESDRAGVGTELLAGLDTLLLVMLVGTLMLTAVVYLLVSRLVLEPILELRRAAASLAAGGQAAGVRPSRRRDEVGELVRDFQRMAREVSETRAELEERVRRATAAVEETQRQLAFQERLAATGRLAAGIAHEINNPLGGAINAVARLDREDLDPAKRAEYRELVAEALERIRVIVSRVLDFARREPEVTEFDLREPLRKAVAFCRHRLEREEVELRDRLPADPLPVRADPGELQQVFLNLVQNALDAMSPGDALTLDGGAEEGAVCLRVRDTGAGMPAAELAASFDYFHTTKPAGQGTGLGLSIAHNLVTRYGGRLRLESEEGAGTTATVCLPRAAAPVEAPAETEPTP
jgi:signal transduction histidine kinase